MVVKAKELFIKKIDNYWFVVGADYNNWGYKIFPHYGMAKREYLYAKQQGHLRFMFSKQAVRHISTFFQRMIFMESHAQRRNAEWHGIDVGTFGDAHTFDL